MKKITRILLALLCLSLPVSLRAQSSLVGLITSEDQLSTPFDDGSHYISNVLDEDADTYWHTGGSPSDPVDLGTQYFDVELEESYDMLMFQFTRRSVERNQPLEWGIYGVPYEDAERSECTFLATIYTPYEVTGETIVSDPFETQGFTTLRFYFDDVSEDPDYDYNTGYTYVAEFQLYEYTSDYDKAMLELIAALDTYRPYLYELSEGTDPGDYDPEACEAFYEAVLAVEVLDDPELAAELTADDLREMAQNMKDTYDAAIATLVGTNKMAIAEGYYFFISGGDSYSDELTKGMYSVLESDGIWAKWDTFEETCPFLWKVTDMGDMEYSIVNMATNATFAQAHNGSDVEMLTDSTTLADNLMVFVVGSEVTEYAYMIINWQMDTGDYYLHCTPSTGTDGYVVGGNNTSASSRWYPVLVSDEDALAIIEEYGDSGDLNADAINMVDDAITKLYIAADPIELITSSDQLATPYDDGSHYISNMLDGDVDTYWHTGGGPLEPYELGTVYFEVELPYVCENPVAFVFARRNCDRNHILEWGVYGVPYEDADQSVCTHLAEIYTPLVSEDEIATSDYFDCQGFTTLRFYFVDTTGDPAYDGDNFGYTYVAEFQMYERKDLSQKTLMGDIFTNLQTAVAAAKLELGNITTETYFALKEAYDAFIDVFVDASEMGDLLEEAEAIVAGLKIGTDPGCWSDASVADALSATIPGASEYYNNYVYTESEVENYVDVLSSQIDAFMDAAIRVETGKWYKIRFATEDEIDENDWGLWIGAADDSNEDLYGKYVTVANLIVEDDYNFIEPASQSELGDICLGQSLYFDEDIDIDFKDYAMFRFINVGDTAYMMQNKATGLFLKATSTGEDVILSAHPSLFNVSPLGCGENQISVMKLDGESQYNLRGAVTENRLVSDDVSGLGSKSGLYIEEVEDVASDYDGTEFNMSIQYGKIYTFCFPVTLTASEGTMYGAYVDDTTITLAPVEGNTTVEAGQPFIYILGDLEDYDDDGEEEPVQFTHGYDIVTEAQSAGSLVGLYYSETVGAGMLVASGNSFTVSRSSTSVADNGAYINGEYSSGDEIVVEISSESFDGVESAIAAVAQDGNIYSIDGKLIGKGNLNSLKVLGKGIYIINGVKVAVK